MRFSSIPLAKLLGMQVILLYLDPKFKDFTAKIDSSYKIRTENGQIHGKWILRKTYENILPKEITWRIKAPIEVGSGTTTLPYFFNRKISDDEFLNKKETIRIKDKVKIRDKEQLFYYEIYKSEIGVPFTSDMNGKTCPQCNSNVQKDNNFCRICGGYPI